MEFDNENVKVIFDELATKTDKTVHNLKVEFQNIRAGRANPHVLDKIMVDYYGNPTPIQQIGNVTVSDGRVLVISVWDVGALKNVEKAILAANIGITPTNDGKVIRLAFPELTEERRKAITKEIKVLAENAKVAIRNIRRDAIESVKKLKKDSLITEDDASGFEKDIDKKISAQTDIIDKCLKEKETEIMSV